MPLTFPGQRYIITWSEWDKSIEVGFYSLTETGLMNRVSTCDFLLQWHERDSFLKRLVTGNEIWISYQNVHRKRIWSKNNRSLTVAKLGLHPKKVLLLFGGIRKCSLLWAPFSRWNHWFRKILQYQLDKLKCHSRKTIKIELIRSLWQCKTACCINCKKKRLQFDSECSTAYSILPRSCSIWVLFVTVIKKFSPW